MTIHTFWALSAEESAKHKHAADAHINASEAAKNYVTERIECDGVFITGSRAIYLGFRRRQDNPMLHKRPAHQHDGQYLYCTKTKTEWNEIVAEAEKIARAAIKFQDYCKEQWPTSITSVLGRSGSGGGFSISETSFGFMGGRVVMMRPVSDGGSVDKSTIPDGFLELTGSQYAELKES
ncbi:hypothetical protein [Arsukibacterium indicum]|uniref:Uncharacterized protein n=1 Tax=Arsukibacterium indicum TaxID=2848612 RepID=A0ABS6MHA5_9GAMM|nr:hypothetical protein [Arsukibacterium indicum]MBV2128195.1 hypothetical protein [Arsukibacterium indicum]